MSYKPPSAQTTLGILLGASEFGTSERPNAKLAGSPAFANSARKVKEYFLSPAPDGFGIQPENWLDLFFDKKQSSPYEVDKTISTFLEERISLMEEMCMQATDVLFYYIGHGILVFGPNQAFHLALRSTDNERLETSAIPISALARTLKAKARHLRRILILDCCFAAESSRQMMQSEVGQAALVKTIAAFKKEGKGSGFPKEGTSLLCSSGYKDVSLLLPDESGTMFSEALISALDLGKIHYPEKAHLSLHDLKEIIEEVLEDLTAGKAPRPEVHSPDQTDGIVADVPLFPNFGHNGEGSGAAENLTTQEPGSDVDAKQDPSSSTRSRGREHRAVSPQRVVKLALPPFLGQLKRRWLLFLFLCIFLSFSLISIIYRYNQPTTTLLSQMTWHIHTSVAPNHLASVAWSGRQFVAVGWYGTILTSFDGIKWIPQNSPVSQHLYKVAWLNSQFIAVGQTGTILTSSDGIKWISRISHTEQDLRGIACSGFQFVAVGNAGTILTSSDGIHWTAPQNLDVLPKDDNLVGVTWSGSHLVAVSENGTILTLS